MNNFFESENLDLTNTISSFKIIYNKNIEEKNIYSFENLLLIIENLKKKKLNESLYCLKKFGYEKNENEYQKLDLIFKFINKKFKLRAFLNIKTFSKDNLSFKTKKYNNLGFGNNLNLSEKKDRKKFKMDYRKYSDGKKNDLNYFKKNINNFLEKNKCKKGKLIKNFENKKISKKIIQSNTSGKKFETKKSSQNFIKKINKQNIYVCGEKKAKSQKKENIYTHKNEEIKIKDNIFFTKKSDNKYFTNKNEEKNIKEIYKNGSEIKILQRNFIFGKVFKRLNFFFKIKMRNEKYFFLNFLRDSKKTYNLINFIYQKNKKNKIFKVLKKNFEKKKRNLIILKSGFYLLKNIFKNKKYFFKSFCLKKIKNEKIILMKKKNGFLILKNLLRKKQFLFFKEISFCKKKKEINIQKYLSKVNKIINQKNLLVKSDTFQKIKYRIKLKKKKIKEFCYNLKILFLKKKLKINYFFWTKLKKVEKKNNRGKKIIHARSISLKKPRSLNNSNSINIRKSFNHYIKIYQKDLNFSEKKKSSSNLKEKKSFSNIKEKNLFLKKKKSFSNLKEKNLFLNLKEKKDYLREKNSIRKNLFKEKKISNLILTSRKEISKNIIKKEDLKNKIKKKDKRFNFKKEKNNLEKEYSKIKNKSSGILKKKNSKSEKKINLSKSQKNTIKQNKIRFKNYIDNSQNLSISLNLKNNGFNFHENLKKREINNNSDFYKNLKNGEINNRVNIHENLKNRKTNKELNFYKNLKNVEINHNLNFCKICKNKEIDNDMNFCKLCKNKEIKKNLNKKSKNREIKKKLIISKNLKKEKGRFSKIYEKSTLVRKIRGEDFKIPISKIVENKLIEKINVYTHFFKRGKLENKKIEDKIMKHKHLKKKKIVFSKTFIK